MSAKQFKNKYFMNTCDNSWNIKYNLDNEIKAGSIKEPVLSVIQHLLAFEDYLGDSYMNMLHFIWRCNLQRLLENFDNPDYINSEYFETDTKNDKKIMNILSKADKFYEYFGKKLSDYYNIGFDVVKFDKTLQYEHDWSLSDYLSKTYSNEVCEFVKSLIDME